VYIANTRIERVVETVEFPQISDNAISINKLLGHRGRQPIKTCAIKFSTAWNIHSGRCDDLRCDMKSCRKSNIYRPQYNGIPGIESASNDVLLLGSDGKFLQRPRHKFMTANWRIILRVRRHFTAHQFGATSD
jgi:hypothetical protein